MRVSFVVGLVLLSTGALAGARSVQLVASFQMFCSLEAADFSAVNDKATAMNLRVLKDREPQRGTRSAARFKAWAVDLATGTHELLVSEASGPKGRVVGCGIAATDAVAAEVREDLIKGMRLGNPSSEQVSREGKHVTTWVIQSEPETITLVQTDLAPTHVPGVLVTLLKGPTAPNSR